MLALWAGVGTAQRQIDVPLAFVENQGQWHTPARFVARRGPITAHFTRGGWTLDLVTSTSKTRRAGCAVRLTFEGADDEAVPTGERALPGLHSFFRGKDPAAWRAHVASYASILYSGMYPGVDVRVRSHGPHLEYDVLLDPGADLQQVVVHCAGTRRIEIDATGTLVLDTVAGPIRQEPPTTWEVAADGARRPVPCRYRRIDGERYGFCVPERDHDSALVIDPGLKWSTFLGGSLNDGASTIIEGPAGGVIVAGWTGSTDFPTTSGAYDTTFNGGASPFDAFVTRMGSDGQVVWSTFLGGAAGGEVAWGLARDQAGDVLVVGVTESPDFPITPGAYQPTFGGPVGTGADGFVSKLSGDGTSLLYSTFLGGSAVDWARGVQVDAAGDVIVAGGTASANFPTTSGAYDTTYNGNGDVYVASLDLAGNGIGDLRWSTFLGGSGRDGGEGIPTNIQMQRFVDIAVDAGGVTVGGITGSANFPVTSGAYDSSYNGAEDFFVARLAADGTTLLASTFFGGTGQEFNAHLGLNRRGEPILGGGSRSANLPTTQGALRRTRLQQQDSCLFRLNRALSRLEYSTYLGDNAASGFDGIDELHVDRAGTVTASIRSDAGFPTTPGAYRRTFSPRAPDVVVLRMRTDDRGARDLHYATYLGSSGGDLGWGVLWDGVSTATVAAQTDGADFPTQNAWQPGLAGSYDATVTRIELLPTGVAVFGTWSPGCNGPVAAGVNQMPQVGSPNFAFTCSGSPDLGSGVLFLAGAPAAAPIRVLGIDLWLDLSTFVALSCASDDLGYAEVALAIPNDPALVNGRAFGQFVWQSPCGAQGLSASNGIDFTIQP